MQDRLLGLETYRIPGSSLRLMPSSLRSILSRASGHRCAIIGNRVPITQNVAHVWPRQYGGPDHLGNVFLLDPDLHDLWDAGLLGVDGAVRTIVSAEMQLFGENVDYFRYAGQALRRRLTGQPYPDAANFARHRKLVFRWPAYKPRWGSSPGTVPVPAEEGRA